MKSHWAHWVRTWRLSVSKDLLTEIYEFQIPVFKMATLTTASDSNKTIVTVEKISHVLDKIGISLKPDKSVQWHDIIASVQESIEIVQDLPDYFPPVDLDKYPRINVHRPPTHENEGNAWAWKSHIQGKAGGPLSGVTFCLKDNITVEDVPMLLGTDMITDYTPQTDASKSPCSRCATM